MRYVLAKSTRHLIWRIRTLALIIGIVLVFGSTSVFARGGGHSGGHGGSHSGGHGGQPGSHRGHDGGHNVNKHGRITTGTKTRGHLMNQNPCPPTDKISEDCLQLGEKQWQRIPAEKAKNSLSPGLSSITLKAQSQWSILFKILSTAKIQKDLP